MIELFRNPWVIGITASVIAGLILYYGFGIGKAKSKKQELNHKLSRTSDAISSPPIEEKPRSNLLPEEIIEYLNGLPPFQRPSAAKNYEGIAVSWQVTLLSMDSTLDGQTYLIVTSQRTPTIPIRCPVEDLARYPEVKIMKAGTKFRVDGQIDHVGDLGVIALRNCQFHF